VETLSLGANFSLAQLFPKGSKPCLKTGLWWPQQNWSTDVGKLLRKSLRSRSRLGCTIMWENYILHCYYCCCNFISGIHMLHCCYDWNDLISTVIIVFIQDQRQLTRLHLWTLCKISIDLNTWKLIRMYWNRWNLRASGIRDNWAPIYAANLSNKLLWNLRFEATVFFKSYHIPSLRGQEVVWVEFSVARS
jgi:hypothetical protein